MPRKQQGWITFQSSEEERQLLEQYSQESQRTKTDILRELVRTLKEKEQSTPNSPIKPAKPPLDFPESSESTETPSQFSARNILKGTIKRIVWGAINAEITLEIAPNVELISIITRASAEKLGLSQGEEAYAVIKSSNIMIGR